MTDGTKQVVWSVSYLPFGGEYQISGPASLDARFPGQWFQLESGLAYNWHRHYDPSLGRYTQPDPLGFVDGPSRYAYAVNSPVMKIDPAGLYAMVTGIQLYDPSAEGRACAGDTATDDASTLVLAGTRSPVQHCQNVNCGAPTGGVYYPLCPGCNDKLKNDGGPILLEDGTKIFTPIIPGGD